MRSDRLHDVPGLLAGIGLRPPSSVPARRTAVTPPPPPGLARSRQFNGASDVIQTAAGSTPSGVGAFTWLCLWRPLAVNAGGIMSCVNAGATRLWGVNPFFTGDMFYAASGFTSMPYAVADNWVLDGFSRAGGGVAQPVTGHHYVYDTATWTHPALGNVGDGGAAADSVYHGQLFSAGEFLNGRLAVIGVWPSVLSNAQVEGLTGGLAAWSALSPAALWAYNQAATTDPLTDLTGHGADQLAITGTTVSTDVPAGFVF